MQILNGNEDLFQRFFHQRKGSEVEKTVLRQVSGVGPSPSFEA